MAERKTKADKIEVGCTKLRLQMLYFDDVNDAGLQLTKFKHQSDLYSGDKLVRCQHEMSHYAEQNGYFFYDKADQNRKMRAVLTPANEEDDLPVDFGSSSSFLDSEYTSPNRKQIDDSNPNPTLNKWKNNILNLISQDRNNEIAQMKKKSFSPQQNPRKKPQRRVFSCPNLNSPFTTSDGSSNESVSPKSHRKRDRVALLDRPETACQPMTELHQFPFYLNKMQRVEVGGGGGEDEKPQLSPTRSIVASEGSNSAFSRPRRQIFGEIKSPGETRVPLVTKELASADNFIPSPARLRMRKHSSMVGTPLSATKLFPSKKAELDDLSKQSGSIYRKKPSLLQKVQQTSRMSIARFTNNLSSDKSDSGGSVENMVANLNRLSRIDIGKQKLNKNRKSNMSIMQSQTMELVELKPKQSMMQPFRNNVIEKQCSVTRQHSIDINSLVIGRLQRSNTGLSITTKNIFKKLTTQLKVTKDSSQGSKKTIIQNNTISDTYRNKLEALRDQLETATWQKEPTEDEVEDKRLRTLYAHGRQLRQTARAVDNFMNNVFCKSDSWKQEWLKIGSSPAIECSSNSTISLYEEEEEQSTGMEEVYCAAQELQNDTLESSDFQSQTFMQQMAERNQIIVEEDSNADDMTTVKSNLYFPQNCTMSMPQIKLNMRMPRQNTQNPLMGKDSLCAIKDAAAPRKLSLNQKRTKFQIKLEYNTINEQQEDSPHSYLESEHFTQGYVRSQQEAGIISLPSPPQKDSAMTGFAINLKLTEQQTESVPNEESKREHPAMEKKPTMTTQQSKMDWLDELEDDIMDEPISQTLARDAKKPIFTTSFSHALPRNSKRIKSEKKVRRQHLSPLNKRQLSPNSCIDRSQLPSNMNQFYQDLSSSDNSSISDHLSKLKSLFQGSNLQQNISRPSSKNNSHSRSPPKIKKHNRVRTNSSLVPPPVPNQPIFRSQSHAGHRITMTAVEKENSTPYHDMLDMMRTTTNEFNKSQKSWNEFGSNGSGRELVKRNKPIQINISLVAPPQQQQQQERPTFQVTPLNLTPVDRHSSRQRLNCSPQGNTNKKMSQQQGV